MVKYEPSEVIAPPATPTTPFLALNIKVESLIEASEQFSNFMPPPVLKGPKIVKRALSIFAFVRVASMAPP